MRQLFDVVTTFVIGAALLGGIGLVIVFTSKALALMS